MRPVDPALHVPPEALDVVDVGHAFNDPVLRWVIDGHVDVTPLIQPVVGHQLVREDRRTLLYAALNKRLDRSELRIWHDLRQHPTATLIEAHDDGLPLRPPTAPMPL